MESGNPGMPRPDPILLKCHTLSDKISADKNFGGQNFRHLLGISAVLSDENFSSVSYFPMHYAFLRFLNSTGVILDTRSFLKF